MAPQEVCVPSALGHVINLYVLIVFDCTRASAEREQRIGRKIWNVVDELVSKYYLD